MSLSANDQLTNKNEGFEVEIVDQLLLKSCQICGRTFNPKSLQRHERICEKAKKSNNRTVFNSFLQRAKEIGAVPVINDNRETKKNSKGKKEENGNSLRRTSGEKNQTDALNNGVSPKKTIPAGYEQCPSCSRCFSQKAADRHIAWCLEQQSRLPNTPPNSEALERLKARVKYRAPLPIKKKNKDSGKRLVKSADSVRESSSLRTHSSPPISGSDASHSKHTALNNKSVPKAYKNLERSVPFHFAHNTATNLLCSKINEQEVKPKKAVKFKEKFPVYNIERNKNLDMLAALRLRLSELNTSDELLDEYVLRSNESEHLRNNHSKMYTFPAPVEMIKDPWNSDGEMQRSTSSSSSGSLPSVNCGENSGRRMPRFCYNCGTKYPIISAKYCCECGAR
ncbi:Protein FAM164A, partial [Stegodyphus mimosarum]